MAEHVGDRLEAARLMAAIYPTRFERALSWVVARLLTRSRTEGLACDLDELRAWLQRRRADRGVTDYDRVPGASQFSTSRPVRIRPDAWVTVGFEGWGTMTREDAELLARLEAIIREEAGRA